MPFLTVLMQSKFILGKRNYGFVLGSVEGFDINTEEEWLVGE